MNCPCYEITIINKTEKKMNKQREKINNIFMMEKKYKLYRIKY